MRPAGEGHGEFYFFAGCFFLFKRRLQGRCVEGGTDVFILLRNRYRL